jgi:hypothetical protein
MLPKLCPNDKFHRASSPFKFFLVLASMVKLHIVEAKPFFKNIFKNKLLNDNW